MVFLSQRFPIHHATAAVDDTEENIFSPGETYRALLESTRPCTMVFASLPFSLCHCMNGSQRLKSPFLFLLDLRARASESSNPSIVSIHLRYQLNHRFSPMFFPVAKRTPLKEGGGAPANEG